MTASIVDLTSRRRNHSPACHCRTDWTCFPHRVVDLADQLRRHADNHAQELLIPTAVLTQVVADALAVLDQITAETLPDHATRSSR